MSYFIKVNFLADKTIGGDIIKHARAYVCPKENIRMTAYKDISYVWDVHNDHGCGNVSREEYDRLCKELGVE